MAKRFMYVSIGILAIMVAFHLGAQYSQAVTQTPEIAIDTGLITHGEQVPLPYYADGTQASQEECVWLLSPSVLHTGHNSTLGFFLTADDSRIVHFEQRTIEGYYFDSTARYLIVGVREAGPTSTQPTTWGKVKAEWE